LLHQITYTKLVALILRVFLTSLIPYTEIMKCVRCTCCR